MNSSGKTDNLIENIQTSLNNSVDSLDAETQSRITQARYRALEQQTKQKSEWWIPATVFASTCLLILMISMDAGEVLPEPAPLQDIEIISNIDDLEFLEELEFYEWLEEYEVPT